MLKRGFYEKQKTTLLVGYYIKMWQSFLQKIKYQGTNLRNMFESIIHNENLVYHYIYPYCSIKKEVRFENNIIEVPTLTYPFKETKNEIIIENTSWSLLKRSELIKYYQIYYIDGLIKDKTSNDGSSIDVHKLINLNLKDHEDTFVPPPPLASGEGESSSAQEIINLDESNFESELKKYKFTLVMFHAPFFPQGVNFAKS
ncbi:uncharacterized protein LOC111060350 isoform X2 [Nilaparvata lugens]|uniref:uncharacterized protein LOC111060350 isoform X2 n=1 Tax=Nilaparvata lugens TaxID=108931 RepID=UPI00193E7E47|nr:uncharacterized protein LOC111060350 isoform X2 [Nilaparvata lugens]